MEPPISIDELLNRWHALQGQGQTVSLEELCSGCPERLSELREHLQKVSDMQAFLQLSSDDAGLDLTRTRPRRPGPTTIPERIGGYEVLGELGRGGMGVVYKARQPGLKRIVAVKMLLGDGSNALDLTRFKTEAKVLARLQHPNIIPIYEIGDHEGRPFFALEYAPGGSLAQKQNGQPMPPREAAELIARLARAVQAAHQMGIVHRDLKPANVLLAADGTPKISDFGLAKMEASFSGSSLPPALTADGRRTVRPDGVTHAGAVIGTPGFMAPEQAQGETEMIGPAADVYALGAMFYDLLTGRPPFQGTSLFDTLEQVMHSEPVPPRRLQPGVPRDLETICLKCLQKKPAQRYATAGELADDVTRHLNREPILARPINLLERAGKWARRRPTAAALVALIFVGLFAAVIGGLVYRANLRRTEAQSQMRGLVDALETADIAAVPRRVEELTGLRPRAEPLLRQRLAERPDDVRLRLALLPYDDTQVEALARRLPDAGLAEMRVVGDALKPHAAAVAPELWPLLQDQNADAGRRLRAACALAQFAPDDPRWPQVAPALAAQLVTEGYLTLGPLTDALRPARHALVPALADLFRDAGRPDAQRSLAASILADFAADQPEVLADLLTVASDAQFAQLLPAVRSNRDRAIAALTGVLKQSVSPSWADPPLDPSWAAPAPDVVQKITAADGWIAERFAFAQSLPLAELGAVTESLRGAGYRPTRVRPYSVGGNERVAVCWARDGQDWRVAVDLTADAVNTRDQALRENGFGPVDCTGYVAGGTTHFAAVWQKSATKDEPRELRVGLTLAEHQAALRELLDGGYMPCAFQCVNVAGNGQYSSVWFKPGRVPSTREIRVGNERLYQSYQSPSNGHLDIQVMPWPLAPAKTDFPAALQAADQRVQKNPGDATALFRRGLAHFRLKQDEAAIADMTAVVKAAPDTARAYQFRGWAAARLGKPETVHDDLASYRKWEPNPGLQAYVAAVAELFQGHADAGLARLDEALAADTRRDPAFPYYAASVYGIAAATVEPKAREYGDRALALLRQAVSQGFRDYGGLRDDADFMSLRDRPEFAAFLRELHLDRGYTCAFQTAETFDSEQLYGLMIADQLTRGRELAEEGYRPVSVSVAEIDAGRPPIAASVWHRPVEPEEAKDRLGRRQAAAAAALLTLGDRGGWGLLRHDPDPRARSYLIHRLPALGVDPQLLVQRWPDESDVSARRALLLALGEFPPERLPAAVREAFTAELLAVYRDYPDPGLHSAADWLLRQRWGQAAALEAIDRGLTPKAFAGPVDSRNWFLNTQGQTFALVRGPVEFWYGTPGSELKRFDSEVMHRRRIDRSVAFATREVTVGEFQRYQRANDIRSTYWTLYAPEPTCPIINVNWYSAIAYCRWLSEQEGVPADQMCYPPVAEIRRAKADGTPLILPADFLRRTGYRLPTDAEWEYACRAGAITTRYYGHNIDLLPKYAWQIGNADERSWPGGRLKPNDLGLFEWDPLESTCRHASLSIL